jgi:hypothetical protein
VKTAIVTTTIHDPAHLDKWVEQLNPGDAVVIAGDTKSPDSDIIKRMVSYTTKYDVDTAYLRGNTGYMCEAAIGWNTIQRRNLAILEAMKAKPDVIFTVDDDNFPLVPYHMSSIGRILTEGFDAIAHISMIHTHTGWYNPGIHLVPPVVHRGFPLTQRRATHSVSLTEPVDHTTKIGVHASLWLGDPDIDAIERINSDPTVRSGDGRTFVLGTDTWSPFNSQATAFRGDLAPLMAVPPGLGRYDDIWGSYIARYVMNSLDYHVAYGEPYVMQDRNPHNLVRDLRMEMHGYEHTEDFINVLHKVKLDKNLNVLGRLRQVYEELTQYDFIEAQTAEFMETWIDDCAEVMYTEYVNDKEQP